MSLLQVNVPGIPLELRAIDRWICWRGKPSTKQNGSPKIDKIPLNPHTGAVCDATDPKNCGTFTQALHAYQTKPGISGIGLMLSEDLGVVGVDLDKCVENGKPNAEGQRLIARLDTYAEVSPSGTGIRLFARGTLPKHGRKKGALEMYTADRFLTVTGAEVLREDGTGRDLEDRAKDILDLYLEVFGNEPEPESENGAGAKRESSILSALLEALIKGDARLLETWERRRKDFDGDQSRYDQALADALVKVGWNDAEIRFAVGAHRKLHGEDTDKVWKRKDYIARTIAKARSGSNRHAAWTEEDTPAKEAAVPFELTDVGNGKRLVHWYGDAIRHSHGQKRWLVWDGKRWATDTTARVWRLAKDTQRRIYSEIALVAGDSKEADAQRQAIAKHAGRSASALAIGNMLKMASSEPAVPVLPDAFDSDPWLLNVQNGTVDLRTGELRKHNRGDMCSKIAAVEFDETAACPTWQAFLWRIMGGQKDAEKADRLISFLARAIGYCLTARFTEKALFIPYGSGDNGKSTFLNTIREMLGEYAKQAAPDLLVAKKHESHPTEIADLAGSRFVSSIETEKGKRLAEALVKWLSGGDKIKGRFMGENFFEFDPTFKLWLATNHLPNVRGTDTAIWKRLKLIPFEEHIPPEEQDTELPDKLKLERPGILRWAIAGCLEWQAIGLGIPHEVEEATAGYRGKMDSLGRFIEECCEVGAGLWVTAKLLYSVYVDWCLDNGEKPMSKQQLGMQLAENPDFTSSKPSGVQTWHGLGVFHSKPPTTTVVDE